MAEFAVAQAAFAGFGVIRRKPWAPVVWSLLYAVVLGGVIVLLGGAFILAIGKLMRATADHAQPKLEDILSLFGGILGGYFLMIFAFWIMGAIINMAVIRAVLEPEASAFAYLRLGRAELWLMLANFLLAILYGIVSTAVSIPVMLITVLVAMSWREGAPFVSLPIQLATWVATIWLGLRFCMVAPMIFQDRKFRLFESWSFTRGRTLRLFQVGLLMVATTMGIYLVLAGIGLVIGVPLAQQTFQALTPQAFFSETPTQVWRTLSPMIGLYVVLVWLGSMLLFPLFFAPWAEAYRQLRGGEIDATFS